MLAIFGITISISMLTVVSLLTDSVSLAFVDFVTTDSGNRDLDISVNPLPTQPNQPNYFQYQPIASQIIANYSELALSVPRYEDAGTIYRVVNGKTVGYSIPFAAMNFTYEYQIKFGSFLNTSYDISQGVPLRQCIVPTDFQDFFQVNIGDNITLWYNNIPINLTIATVSDTQLKFTGLAFGGNMETRGVMISFETFVAWQGAKYTGTVNHLIFTLKNPEQYYDIRDVSGSTQKMLVLSESIQENIGWGYNIDMPKLYYLQFSSYLTAGMTIIFVLISIISMLIAGILINGILSTSVEERIREFGIFRTLGARKMFNIKLIIYQGVLLSLGGTTLGVVGAMILTKYLVIPIADNYVAAYIVHGIPFVVSPTAILLSYGIGIGVSLAVSISPAMKVARLKIVEAINPYRHEETLYKIMRESSVNYKLIIVGVILAINGGFIFFVIPQMLASLDFTLFAGVLIVVLVVFLLGLTFAGLGLMPLLQRALVAAFTPFFKKVINIVRITLYRYARRNSTTVLMFSISFAFIIFTTSVVSDLQSNISTLQRFDAGSEIVLHSDMTRGIVPTTDLQQQLMQIPGIEKTSMVVARPNLLTQIYSASGVKYSASIGDYINFQSSSCTLCPVDQYYWDTIYSQYVQFSQGSMADAFPKIFDNSSDNCIISEALAGSLSINMGDQVRLTFTRGTDEDVVPFTVVGVAGMMPGFTSFSNSQILGSSSGGVMISQEKYEQYMDLPSPAWVEKIFIKVQDEQVANVLQIQQVITDKFASEYGFTVTNVEQAITNQASIYSTVSLIFDLILGATVMICLFGLLASTYSTILERRREVAVLRTLGLRGIGISTLFSLEAMITFLTSALAGSIIGYLTAYLLTGDLNLFTGSPQTLGFPWSTVIGIFSISATFLLVGLAFMLHKIKSQKIIDIYRETL